MSPSEALSVKINDVLESKVDTTTLFKGQTYLVKFMHRYTSGLTYDRGVDLIDLTTGNHVYGNLQDFVFADITKSFRSSGVWIDYIAQKYIPCQDLLLEYLTGLDQKINSTNSKVEKSVYQNEKEATKVMLDILNGIRDKNGIELCEIQ